MPNLIVDVSTTCCNTDGKLGFQQIELHDIRELGRLLDELSAENILFVVDRHALAATGIAETLRLWFDRRRVIEFSNFVENPRLEDVCAGVDVIRGERIDAVLAIGGGTAIDVAKLVRCFASQDAAPKKLVAHQNEIKNAGGCPLIVVPTTSGTGSEATHFAVVYIDGVKHSVAHESIMPDAAIVDPYLTWSMPPRLTAVTGLDALSQAIESLWSVNSTDESMNHALESLDLNFANLHSAVHAPTPDVRSAMSRAANLSGKAINISKTTAPHACSYAITVGYGVPHGHAAAITLAAFLGFNQQVSDRDVTDPRGALHVHQMIQQIVHKLGCTSVPEAQSALTALLDSIGCPTRLRDIGMTMPSQIQQIIDSVNASRLANNPRLVTEDDLRSILQSIQ